MKIRYLPIAVEKSPRDGALCAETDPGVFFPERGDSTRPAKQICGLCDVRAACLDYALTHDERFGVWGGTSENERRRLRRDAAAATRLGAVA